ncbi:MAG: type II toxin-antitoxin system RelE/ParE family toxin [Pseudomonadota bacterium]
MAVHRSGTDDCDIYLPVWLARHNESAELKIDHGPGYRVYFVQHSGHDALLLAGGDKSTQSRDIKKATELARKYAE